MPAASPHLCCFAAATMAEELLLVEGQPTDAAEMDQPHSGRRLTVGISVALQALQIGPNLGCMLIAKTAILFQRLVDDLF